MSETEAEFVERIARNVIIAGSDLSHLFALARRGAHLCDTARSLGWRDDGVEGAFEFITRRTREVALEDARFMPLTSPPAGETRNGRSEEHTSELQSHHDIV